MVGTSPLQWQYSAEFAIDDGVGGSQYVSTAAYATALQPLLPNWKQLLTPAIIATVLATYGWTIDQVLFYGDMQLL